VANLRSFGKRMNVLGSRVVANSNKLVRTVALVADQVVVMGTPVDTGRARSNWIVSLNHPADGIIEAYSPGESGSTQSQNVAAALAQGEAVISRYASEDQEIHLTNNLPYIQELNDGRSDQAGANYIENGIAAAVAAVDDNRGLLSIGFGGR
jgi:hypothetical protein